MPDRRPSCFPNARFLPWLLLYALVVAYSSTIVGPAGMNYVPVEPDAAWQAYLFRALTWVDNGSDQRADWMGNLSMLVPLGFLLTASLAPRQGAGPVTLLAALLIGSVFVLGVKYAQLFFPPRTVTLNYVVAQVSGAAIGIGLFAGAQGRLGRLALRRVGGSRETLRNILILYATGVFGFLLMPLDFALSLDDLATRFGQVPGLLFVMPGAGRPPIVQATVSIASALAMVPFGALMVLAPRGRNRLFSHAMLHGLGWLTLVFCLTAVLLSGTPALVSFLTRIAGLAMGVRIVPWIIRQDPLRLRQWLAFMSLWAVPPYLVLLVAVNGLASTHWLSTGDAIANVHVRGLLPLFNYYIVTKAEAAKNIAAHIVMYAPIGLLVWVRSYRPGVALGWGVLVALLVETGRFMRPGLQGDLNAVVVAGLTALLTAQLMPGVWRLLEGVILPTSIRATVQGPGWRERAAAARSREAAVSAASGPEADRL